MTTTPAIERPTRAYRLVRYHYDPFLGGQFPFGAIVREGDEESFVRAPRMPDLRGFPGEEALLEFVMHDLGPRGPYKVPAPNVYFSDEVAVPESVADVAGWALEMLAGGRRAVVPSKGETPPDGRTEPGRSADLSDSPPSVERVQEHFERHGGHWLVTAARCELIAGGEPRPTVLCMRVDRDRKYPYLHAFMPGFDLGGHIERGDVKCDPWSALRGSRFIPLGADGLPLRAAPAAPPAPAEPLDALDLWAAGAEAALDACAATLGALAEKHEREADEAKVCGSGSLAEVPEAERANAQLARLAMMCGLASAKALKGAREKVLALPVPTPPLTRPAAPDDVLMAAWIGGAAVELDRGRRAAPPRQSAAVMTAGERRAETGVVQFGEDWPGVFIRGDVAHAWAHGLSALGVGAGVEGYTDADIASGRAVRLMVLANLRELLLRSDVGAQGHRVDALLLPFPACAAAAVSPPLVHLVRAVSALAGLDDAALDALTLDALRRVLERRGWRVTDEQDEPESPYATYANPAAPNPPPRGVWSGPLVPREVVPLRWRLDVRDCCEAVATMHGNVAPAVVLAEVLAEVGR